MNPQDIHLAFFLSRATPLNRWEKMGILDRETAIYKELSQYLGSVSIVTSGGVEELAYKARLGNIRILHNRWGLSPNTYSLLAPFLHWSAMRRATIYKTNQPDGSWTGIIAGIVHRKPAIVRAGYLWAEFNRQEGGSGRKAALIDRLQAFSFERADAIFLTTQAMKRQVINAYRVLPDKVQVIPNYVDTRIFHPMPDVEPIKGRICYVGRLHPCKNLDKLIEAVSRIPQASLVLIGQGAQRSELEVLARSQGGNSQFKGMIPHTQLPPEINRSEVFILPSSSEGHPKALIEAMACGVAAIGTDVEGIRNVIVHGETGLLCPPTVEGIVTALRRLLEDESLRLRLGRAARAFVEREYSLAQVTERELAVLQQVQNRWKPAL
jgi:glycosyltransferase involved in cell wall biosynthesis